MSHFSKLKTSIKDARSLVAALEDMGFKDQVLTDEKGIKLEGYDSASGGKAEIVIRRKHLSGGYNDIGFRKAADGTYEALISDPTMMKANRNTLTAKIKGGFGKEWMDVLNMRYNLNVVKGQAEDLGWAFTEEYEGDELVCRVSKDY